MKNPKFSKALNSGFQFLTETPIYLTRYRNQE